MLRRSWVKIPALDTRWTFFTFICRKNCVVCLKRPKINKKKPGVDNLKKQLDKALKLIPVKDKNDRICCL